MKSSMPPLPAKKAVALDLLERTSLFVHLDPRRPGVIVPLVFAKQPQLVLQIGLNMAIAIPDLEVGDGGISCTLSFNRRPHFCRLPWSAIYALIGQEGGGMVWPEDVPPEVVAQQRSAGKKEAPARKPALRAVETADSADRQSSPDRDEAPHAQRSPQPLTKAEPSRNKQQGLRSTAPSPSRGSSLPPRVVHRSDSERSAPERRAELEPTAELSALETPSTAPELASELARPSSESSAPGATKRVRPPYLRLVR